MNKFLVLTFISILLSPWGKIAAQDIFIKNNNDTIHCIIKEIGDQEIKYLTPEVSKTVIFGINKDKVNKVVFTNGNEIKFTEFLYDPKNYVDDKKNNIKINFLSPIFNSTNICYEKSIKPGRSAEATIGIIGAGWDIGDNDESGVFVKMGYKFIKSPDYYIRGQKFAHILKGAYIRPELAFSYYTYQNYDYYSTYYTDEYTKETNIMMAVLLNIGKQWVFENNFLVDCFVGAGYGFGQDDSNFGLHKAFIGGIDEFPLALTMGIRVGWNF